MIIFIVGSGYSLLIIN